MIFSTPLSTPEALVSFIEGAVKKNSPPVEVSVGLEKDTKNIIVTLSKIGTSTILIKTSRQENGLYCEAEIKKISSFHKPFMATVESWIIDNVIIASGGLIYLDALLSKDKKTPAICISGGFFILSLVWFFSALLYLIFKK